MCIRDRADRLKDTESIAVEYRAQSGSWHLARFIVKKRNPSGKVTNVLYVVRQIDKEKQVEITYKQELIKKNRILSGLSRDYTTAFVLNLDTDEYEFVFNQETNHAPVSYTHLDVYKRQLIQCYKCFFVGSLLEWLERDATFDLGKFYEDAYRMLSNLRK